MFNININSNNSVLNSRNSIQFNRAVSRIDEDLSNAVTRRNWEVAGVVTGASMTTLSVGAGVALTACVLLLPPVEIGLVIAAGVLTAAAILTSLGATIKASAALRLSNRRIDQIKITQQNLQWQERTQRNQGNNRPNRNERDRPLRSEGRGHQQPRNIEFTFHNDPRNRFSFYNAPNNAVVEPVVIQQVSQPVVQAPQVKATDKTAEELTKELADVKTASASKKLFALCQLMNKIQGLPNPQSFEGISNELIDLGKEILLTRLKEKDEEELTCAISLDKSEDFVIGSDGEIYDRDQITNWLKSNKTSPATRDPMDENELVSIPKAILDAIKK